MVLCGSAYAASDSAVARTTGEWGRRPGRVPVQHRVGTARWWARLFGATLCSDRFGVISLHGRTGVAGSPSLPRKARPGGGRTCTRTSGRPGCSWAGRGRAATGRTGSRSPIRRNRRTGIAARRACAADTSTGRTGRDVPFAIGPGRGISSGGGSSSAERTTGEGRSAASDARRVRQVPLRHAGNSEAAATRGAGPGRRTLPWRVPLVEGRGTDQLGEWCRTGYKRVRLRGSSHAGRATSGGQHGADNAR